MNAQKTEILLKTHLNKYTRTLLMRHVKIDTCTHTKAPSTSTSTSISVCRFECSSEVSVCFVCWLFFAVDSIIEK